MEARPLTVGEAPVYLAYAPDKMYKDVADRRQLFIDDDVVAAVQRITRRQHTPEKHPENPMIKRDRPWEVIPYFRTPTFNVIRDPEDGLFRCWYEDYYDYFNWDISKEIQANRLYYAQSEDGLNWEKPELGKHYVDGHDTNTVFSYTPGDMASCNSVFLDPKENDPSRRFKTVYYHRAWGVNTPKKTPAGPTRDGLCMAFSPDGIDWTPWEGNPLFPVWLGDVEILTYDSIDEKYVLYGRYGGRPGGPIMPGKPEGVWSTRRRIYRAETEDLFNWPEPELWFDPGSQDNLDDELYGFVPWRADEMHLGLLNVLHLVDNTMEMYLHHSRDGRNWNRMAEHRPFIERGGEGGFDMFGVETPSQPLEVDDEVWFYYGGMNVHHDWWIWGVSEGLVAPETQDASHAQNGHHLCLATLRRDGYVSLDATLREGWVETKPVFSTGAHLYVNGRCQPGGYIDVEVTGPDGIAFEGYSREQCERFTGDDVRHRMRWSGRETVNEIPGYVKLRFFLQNAELYGFQFDD